MKNVDPIDQGHVRILERFVEIRWINVLLMQIFHYRGQFEIQIQCLINRFCVCLRFNTNGADQLQVRIAGSPA